MSRNKLFLGVLGNFPEITQLIAGETAAIGTGLNHSQPTNNPTPYTASVELGFSATSCAKGSDLFTPSTSYLQPYVTCIRPPHTFSVHLLDR
jgi:hypothetical protein